jgi:TLC domain
MPLIFDETLKADPVWATTEAATTAMAFSAGYFVWDVIFSTLNYDVFGWQFLCHGILCLTMYTTGTTPFCQWYGCLFLMFELSTPFVNLHFAFEKAQFDNKCVVNLNKALLFVLFTSVRVIMGPIMSYYFWIGVWTSDPARSLLWVRVLFLFGNGFLCCLNFLWFSYMLRAAFCPTPEKGNKDE